MRFYADLHIHSKYSRATSRDCDLENLAYWGRKKGITVIGTGDFTHPAWIQEIKEKLVPAEPGLFRLRDDIESKVTERLPSSCRNQSRFMLSVEISTIYKKGDKTRKVHHLVYAPSIEKAEKISAALERIGNIRSDGRPILGLDSRHLLEIVLNAGSDCYLVPAHIWTPWFAVLGSKSGFDTVADCYADLADHVFAVETGLSSDPEMNWKVSHLDRYRLMSNSDAHSPPKLGREACVFDTDLDYFSMKRALETGSGFDGTVEFFPEEGKYHMDGHRNCNICFHPEESKKHGGICPVCSKPLTLGVMYRVEELADRHDGCKPATAADFKNIIPLPEILGEVLQTGPASNAVGGSYEALLSKLGSEFQILTELPIHQLEKHSSSLFGEAIRRMRTGQVIRQAGYDGEYGVIRLFEGKELQNKLKSSALFDMEVPATSPRRRTASRVPDRNPSRTESTREVIRSAPGLDSDQAKALQITEGPLIIMAGPGSGKTRTLTHRIAKLIAQDGIDPRQCLAIAFTNRAVNEIKERLIHLIPEDADKVPVMTFHALGFSILKENRLMAGLERGFRLASPDEIQKFLTENSDLSERKCSAALKAISKMKRERLDQTTLDDSAKTVWHLLEGQREKEGWLDFDDLLTLAVDLLEQSPELTAFYQDRYRWISIDEYQDIDTCQYRLIRLLMPADGNLCAIGDPDQAIYSFRGANVAFFQRFEEDFSQAKKLILKKNYRSSQTILSASQQMILPATLVGKRSEEALFDNHTKITIHPARSDRAEAEFVVSSIEKMIGGTSFFSMDSKRSKGDAEAAYSFSDFVVLYRTDAQAEVLEEAFKRSGIPYKKYSHRPLPRFSDAETPVELNTFEMDLIDTRSEQVALLTLHAAKGLEFDVVFITGCEEGILPLQWGSSQNEEERNEERRLFFVGMTRAKSRLILTHAQKRFWQGKIREQQPSAFLKDIERKLLEQTESEYRARKVQDDQLNLFS